MQLNGIALHPCVQPKLAKSKYSTKKDVSS